jgi:hypothetical protein
MTEQTQPIDYEHEARLKKATDLADVLMRHGWVPNSLPVIAESDMLSPDAITKLRIDTWIQAVIESGRKPVKKKGVMQPPSVECQTLTIKFLEERWKERKKK